MGFFLTFRIDGVVQAARRLVKEASHAKDMLVQISRHLVFSGDSDTMR